MDAKLRYVEIKKLFGQYDVEWNIDKDTTVLVGQNGSGKTTILNILISVLTEKDVDDGFRDTLAKIKNCNIKFSNNGEVSMSRSKVVSDINNKLLLSSLKDAQEKLAKNDEKSDEYIALSNFIEIIADENFTLDGAISITGKGISLDNIQIEFISTLNMNANAVNPVIGSNGKRKNHLDDEIELAILKFQKLKERENYSVIKDKAICVLNDFFSTTQKAIELSDTDFVIKNLKKEVLKLSQLSAGERQIIYIVFKVATAYFNEALILMDEPEISLHLEWQEKLLKNLREINDKSQMIVVTHSPAIIMDGWMDSYVDIQTILKPIKDDE